MTFDERVRARMHQTTRLAGAIAHQLGATMLPSIRTPSELEGDRNWKRLAFQTTMIVDHLKHQKQALDVFRSKLTGDLDALQADLWCEWVQPLVQATLTRAEGVHATSRVEAPVELGLSHAILAAALTVDEHLSSVGSSAGSVDFEVVHTDSETSVALAWSDAVGDLEIPQLLTEAAERAGLHVEVDGSRLSLA